MLHNHLIGAAVTNVTTAAAGTAVVAMTDTVSVAIVGGVVSLITGIATLYFAYKAKINSADAKTNSAEAKEVSVNTGKAVDGKMEEFKAMAEAFYHAKGVADEKVAAEAKAGIEAIAKAKGKAEAEAKTVVQPVIAAPPPAQI